ncbi:cell division protein FtsX [Commensalibacter communis]|uniref:cell division protein FtsX n=1 Tax=Commensalibacter communis TaxID=2972786 RepID=UPI00232AA533|nr:FtsX-like permease family protein [Commensalibacter communis]
MMLFKYKTSDGLKLHRALPGQFLIPLVAAMTFLAALSIAGAYASQQLAKRWSAGAASTIILQIPMPNEPLPSSNQTTTLSTTATKTKIQSVIAILSTSKELDSFHQMTDKEIDELLAPWLHESIQSFALPIPAIIELHLKHDPPLSITLEKTLKQTVPDISIEQSNFWNQRLNALANSLQTSAFLALIIVISVAATVIALSTRTGLMQCKQTIEILHNLGASDAYISFRFANRSAFLASVGGTIGSVFSVPLLLFLTYLSLPFSSDPNWQALSNASWFYFLITTPFQLFGLFILLPICNYFIGWITTTIIVYFWLRRLT